MITYSYLHVDLRPQLLHAPKSVRFSGESVLFLSKVHTRDQATITEDIVAHPLTAVAGVVKALSLLDHIEIATHTEHERDHCFF